MPDGAKASSKGEGASAFSPSAQGLADLVKAYNPDSDSDLICRAYAYGAAAHDGQLRRSGEPYFTHPIEVAVMIAEQRLDDATIVTALLHDTVEDTQSTHNEVVRLFGEEIANLVGGVTKLTKLQLASKETRQAEDFRKLFLAMSADIRVLLVKLSDRLHNMRTIRHMSPEKQAQKASETMEIYAPLAGRMGMQEIRDELEDLSFKVLNPKARDAILRHFVTLRRETVDVIPAIARDIEAELAASGVIATVTGREKRPYSIWKKLRGKGEVDEDGVEEQDPDKFEFHRLSDVFAFRIVTGNEADCYVALGSVHRRWASVPGRFKDYISQPKTNGYRSIHTTVSGRRAKRVEIQIRTQEMHEVAESGVAAHWSYKDGVRLANRFATDPVTWLKGLQDRLISAENPAEFLEHVKLEMFSDQVFCFTPTGEVVKLPRGATPIDFAYAIHTKLGDSCVGAKADGKRIPLFAKLRNGQAVVIISAPGQTPPITWEDHVVTGKAKAAIRRAARDEKRAGQIRLGREFARVAFEKVGKKLTDKALATAAKRFSGIDRDELLRQIGATEQSADEVVSFLYPERITDERPMGEMTATTGVIGLQPGQSVKPATCCRPLPGERIVGITFRGDGVVVHAIDCPRLSEYEDQPRRWVDLNWGDGESLGIFHAELHITLGNDAGVLGRVCSLIGEHQANIADIELMDRKPDFYTFRFELEVRDLQHILRIQTAIETDSAVTTVKRIRTETSTKTAV